MALEKAAGTRYFLFPVRIPHHRILPRLGAYSETAWSLPEKKNWYDFLHRQEKLRAAGYEDYLRSLS